MSQRASFDMQRHEFGPVAVISNAFSEPHPKKFVARGGNSFSANNATESHDRGIINTTVSSVYNGQVEKYHPVCFFPRLIKDIYRSIIQ